MNLKYKITLDDYLEYYRKESKDFCNNIWIRSLSTIIIGFCFIFGIYIIYAAIAHYSGQISSIFWWIFFSFALLGVGIAFLFVFNPELRARSSYKELKKTLNENKKPSLIAERNITVNKNGLSFEAQTLQIFVDWDLFNYISETDNLLILNFHGKELQLIPKRCFDNSEEIEQFRELLHDRAKNLDNNPVISEKDGILKLEYQLEPKDYLEAAQANNLSKKWLALLYPFNIFMFLYSGFSTMWKGIDRPELSASNILGSREFTILSSCLLIGSAFGLLLTMYPKTNIFIRKKIAKNWHNNKPMQSDIKLIVTENEIVLMSDYFQDSIAWQEYLNYIENKKLFLLYYSERDYQIIPKQAFQTEEQIKQFRELIQSQNNITKISF